VIWRALRDRAGAGAAVVVVSHRADATVGADAVYRMHQGRLGPASPMPGGGAS
jgi:ABC-type transport system involved in cytochrome bd biosynthesis fused ATPase/permease subunit